MKHIKKFNESVNITEDDIKKQADIYMTDAKSKDVYGNGEWQYSDVITAFKEGARWACGMSNTDKIKEIEKATFQTLTPYEKEKMMSDALKLREEEWMKKYKVGDHGDYLRMAKAKWNID